MNHKDIKKERLNKYLNPSAMAYGDLRRTIRPLKTGVKSKDTLKLLSEKTVMKIDKALPCAIKTTNQTEFNSWHHKICKQILDDYNNSKDYRKMYREFFYGQAQKWINMTLKNKYLLSDDIDVIYGFLHIPVDKIILKAAFEEIDNSAVGLGIKELVHEDSKVIKLNKHGDGHPWSRWCYEDYKSFQEAIIDSLSRKEKYKDKCRMDWEFDAWKP